jgi:hypothetical protein
VTHPDVSRRIAKLKPLGVVDPNGHGWEIDEPASPRQPKDGPWARPIEAGAYHLPPPIAERDKGGRDERSERSKITTRVMARRQREQVSA